MTECFNGPLLHCAIEKISSVVWGGTDQRVGDIHAVQRAPSEGKERRLELYYVASEPDPAAIAAMLRAGSYARAHDVVLIGEHNRPAIDELETSGFGANWHTVVYSKRLDHQPSSLNREATRSRDAKFCDVTVQNLALANSVYADFKITKQSTTDPSFINRLMMIDDICVGKIQLILCPPHGTFCVLGAIKESERRRGYFKMMMNAAEAWARECSLPLMALFSSEHANKINLYPKLGYTQVGTYEIFERTAGQ